jgi:hypothetical protein
VRRAGAPWIRLEGGKPQFLAIALAGNVVIDCLALYMLVIRIGDAAEHIWFSLGGPDLKTGSGEV